MAALTQAAILDALRSVQDPDQKRDIVALGLVQDLEVREGEVHFTLAFAGQSPATKVAVHSAATRAVGSLPGVSKVQARMGGAGRPPAARQGGHGHAHGPAPAADLIPDVKHTIAVS